MAVRVAFDEVDSTQSEAIRRALGGAPDSTYVVAAAQRAGRGRLDRSWASPRGGLYLSWVGSAPSAAPGLLPLAVGAEVRAAIHSGAGVATALKWPNDLVVPGPSSVPQKLVGILVDQIMAPDLPARVVVGVGMNVSLVRSALPQELRSRAAILSELTDRDPSVSDVERWVVAALPRAFARLETPEGASGVVAECRRHLYGVGEPVQVDGVPAGILRDLAEDGAATVERDGVVVPIHAGDLTVAAAA
jgi:BirA family biotin operon repressor/biotin-[acetyl-CoA-carboxylase] ligase